MIILGVIVTTMMLTAAQVTVSVEAEEDVYTLVSPNNGSGPLWSYGCTSIVRLGERVIVSQMETGKDVPLLCNTRWRILDRGKKEWKLLAEAEGYRQREPCSLATVSRDSFFLNVNDSQEPPGTKYGTCKPHLLEFRLENPDAPKAILPKWKGKPYFTDHSYRGFAADRNRAELLMLNIDAKTSVENWCLLKASGEVLRNGGITFPIRSCYPQVALDKGAAHVLAIGDIREPVEEWAKYKFEQTQREWDYVFRILHYTSSPDLHTQDFADSIEVANVDATAGYIGNQDLWIAPDGSAFVLYTQREVQSALLRDKFFPGKSILNSLHLAVIKDNEIVERRTLIKGIEGEQPGCARFHVTPNGQLDAFVYLSGSNSRNILLPVYPQDTEAAPIPVPLETPFSSYCLASVRAGNEPSNIIDVLGQKDAPRFQRLRRGSRGRCILVNQCEEIFLAYPVQPKPIGDHAFIRMRYHVL